MTQEEGNNNNDTWETVKRKKKIGKTTHHYDESVRVQTWQKGGLLASFRGAKRSHVKKISNLFEGLEVSDMKQSGQTDCNKKISLN